jgi:hypothetical protein
VLARLAKHDDVVPEEHTHRLMASWAGAKKLIRIPGTTHLDIPYQAATLNAIATWLGYALGFRQADIVSCSRCLARIQGASIRILRMPVAEHISARGG